MSSESQAAVNEDPVCPAHLALQFRVFLVSASTGRYTQERRDIAYWFKEDFASNQRAYVAQEFFKTLVSPVDFPRDYVGFIKKIMKLMQKDFPMIARIEVQLTQEKEMESLPNRPTEAEQSEQRSEVSPDSILCAIEEAYPNSLTIDDMARRYSRTAEEVKTMVMTLVERKLVKAVGVGGREADVDSAAGAFRRVHQNEDQVTVVKQRAGFGGLFGFDAGPGVQQPTIAVITSQYVEKMAVDAVMTNRQTFVRYATVGEANVYTLGDIGSHRVVTTKLPMTGHNRDALIATGSTTTRLLGTFQGVEHVFLVGVGGAVPHYTDFEKHVRLGDVVISAPSEKGQRYIYEYCENATCCPDSGDLKFESRSWCPVDLALQDAASEMIKRFEHQPSEAPWLKHFNAGLKELEQACPSGEGSRGWRRPSGDSDKLYMSVGGDDVIEVGHPTPKEGRDDPRSYGEPMLHLGPVAAGRKVALHDQLRQEYAARHGVRCFDTELDAVMESIYGNRKDCYMLIRGITDYKDGTREREWQQYSSLMAAAVLRAVIEEMGSPTL